VEWAEHLASHGYVVVAVDHFDSSTVVYPDGTYLFTDPSDQLGREAGVQYPQNRVREFAVVLEVLAQWNENDALFAGRLDAQNVAAFGWSYGGLAAGEFCRIDSRCKAAISLDGGRWADAPLLVANGLQKPSLTMGQMSNGDQTLFSKATTNAYWFQVQNTEHFSFSRGYWWVTSTSLPNRRETARTITDWSLWFLNKYLKGSADPMPQTANYPQIFNFKQK
jgi:dienelactone hydrolase